MTKVGLSRIEVAREFHELQDLGDSIEYHVINAETPDAVVSQHEHTIIIKDDGVEVTTYLDRS